MNILIKNYINENPEDATNCEDMLNFILDEFDVQDDNEIEHIWRYIRANAYLPK